MTTAGAAPLTRMVSLPSAGIGSIVPGPASEKTASDLESTSTVSPAAARGRDLAYSARACITWPRQRVEPPGAVDWESSSQRAMRRASGALGFSLATHHKAAAVDSSGAFSPATPLLPGQ